MHAWLDAKEKQLELERIWALQQDKPLLFTTSDADVKNLQFYEEDIARVEKLKQAGEICSWSDAVKLSTNAMLNLTHFKTVNAQYLISQQESPVFVVIKGKIATKTKVKAK